IKTSPETGNDCRNNEHKKTNQDGSKSIKYDFIRIIRKTVDAISGTRQNTATKNKPDIAPGTFLTQLQALCKF
ncbi:TPA: hypothetical protein ACHKI9_004143, partial [Escherichia coli]